MVYDIFSYTPIPFFLTMKVMKEWNDSYNVPNLQFVWNKIVFETHKYANCNTICHSHTTIKNNLQIIKAETKDWKTVKDDGKQSDRK